MESLASARRLYTPLPGFVARQGRSQVTARADTTESAASPATRVCEASTAGLEACAISAVSAVSTPGGEVLRRACKRSDRSPAGLCVPVASDIRVQKGTSGECLL